MRIKDMCDNIKVNYMIDGMFGVIVNVTNTWNNISFTFCFNLLLI